MARRRRRWDEYSNSYEETQGNRIKQYLIMGFAIVVIVGVVKGIQWLYQTFIQ